MKEIFSTHRQEFNEIRKLCLICHGLDLSTSSFSLDTTDWNISGATERVLQNVISSNLLHLAIALRINIYQNNIINSEKPLPNSAWFYYDKELNENPATLKQVCDKIIHADTVSKLIYPNKLLDHTDKISIQLQGKEYKKYWTMNIVLDLLAKDILLMLDEIENNNLNPSPMNCQI